VSGDPPPLPVPVLGVDGWKGSWVAARVVGREVSWRRGRFAELLSPDLAVVAVDIPIGLATKGPRGCDAAVRAALGSAASRVFLVPPRYAIEADTHAEANSLLRAAGAPGVSVQTWGLRSAVLEVDRHAADPRLVEVHPELSFLRLSGDVLPPKKTARGVAERIVALSAWIDVVEVLRSTPPRVPVDDALDALAAAWSAQRVAVGAAAAYPSGGALTDDSGRAMVIRA
jgi:predicted RNase H-like nuclease